MKKVLVVGMSGRIGRALLNHLFDNYDFTALSRHPMEGVRSVTGDITDLESILPFFKGHDVVVHLAAALSNADPDAVLRSNIIGIHNVFEAARLTGIERVVYASSSAVVWNYSKESPWGDLMAGTYKGILKSWRSISHLDPVRPRDLYACSKVWGEALGRYYADTFGISVLCIRFGSLPESDDPGDARSPSIWCSHRDAAQIIDRCIRAPKSLGFDVFFGVSNNKYGYLDIEHAQRIIGYAPRDSAD
jgi:nucleoside-diphosphate-sugar epimerase